jgi:hypothetical protein
MGDGTRLAIAILILFGAMVCFFFAFHPGGVQGVSDPDTMLQWLMGEFQNTANPSLTPDQIAAGATTTGGGGGGKVLAQLWRHCNSKAFHGKAAWGRDGIVSQLFAISTSGRGRQRRKVARERLQRITPRPRLAAAESNSRHASITPLMLASK